MSIGFSIAIDAFPFLELLDKETEGLVEKVLEAGTDSDTVIYTEMDACRRRLAQGVDAFVRSLPTLVRNDANTSRAAAYTLVGLVDERMLHHSAGGLERWRERLLEYELYGSALAGQEVVSRAQAAAQGSYDAQQDSAVLAPLYLAIFRSGFEGSLRGDVTGLALLINSLEQTVGANHDRQAALASDVGLKRVGFSPNSMAIFGILLWLVSGFFIWFSLSFDTLQKSDQLTDRISRGLPSLDDNMGSIVRSIGPSSLPPVYQNDDNPQ